MTMLNAHVAVMQMWAWGTMLNDRIPEQGIEQAFDSTFSGDYPCEKCRAIAKYKAQQLDTEKEIPQPKLEEFKPAYFASSQPRSHEFHLYKAIAQYSSSNIYPPYSLLASIHGPPPKLLV